MEQQYVGIDLHRRRSVMVRTTPQGEVVEQIRFDNDPVALALEIAKAGPNPEVVLEATYGWYWAADVLKANGAKLHLAHPLGVTGFKNRRVKKDVADASHLADLLRMNRLPESWIAPAEVRELRELVRYRAKLVALRSGIKAQVHSVLAKEGVRIPMTDLFGVDGTRLLDEVELGRAYARRVSSLRELIVAFDGEVFSLNRDIAQAFSHHAGYRAIQVVPGIGPVIASILVAEIGDVTRFATPAKLCSWAWGDPETFRIRCCGPPRPYHQAGVKVGALGHYRSRRQAVVQVKAIP
jgi:transposase